MTQVPLPSLDRYRLHYRGNLTGKIEGQIVGPNIFGERFTITETEYDEDRDRTTARVRFTTVDDLKQPGS